MAGKRGCLIAASFWLGVFLVLDVVAGHWRWKKLERAGAQGERLEKQYRVSNDYYHHDLKPNFSTDSAMWGPLVYKVRTNSLGFRDTIVRAVPPRATRPRVLLIGDSFTEGLGVRYDSTVGGILTTRLAVAGLEVVNAAVLSYSPAIYWKKIQYLLEQRSLEISAVVVFIDISDIEDDALAYRIDSAGRVVDAPELAPSLIGRWAHNSISLRAASKLLRIVHPHAPYGGCFSQDVMQDADCRAGWTLSPTLMKRYGTRGLTLADAHMSELAKLLRARNIPLTVVVYPWPQQLQWDDRHSLQESHWRTWSAREGAHFISLFAAFFGAADAEGLGPSLRRLFITNDVHWNAAGHRLVADTVTARLTPPQR